MRWSACPPRAPEPFLSRGDGRSGLRVGPRARGTLGIDDMAAYEPIERQPVSARFRGHEVLTNPPPPPGAF